MTTSARSYITACADSINLMTSAPDVTLPFFITCPCLDYEKKYWWDIHHPLLIRKAIIDGVKNVQAIEYILNYGDKRISEKCDRQPDFGKGLTYYKVELLDKSFADLLKERLQQLKH